MLVHHKNTIGTSLVLAMCWFVIGANSASAYVDPSTGSYLVQIIVAGLTTIPFIIKAFWHKITAALPKKD